MNDQPVTSDDVLHFWFEETDPRDWWAKSDAFDGLLRARFGELLQRARRCELYEWRATPGGRLAEVIVLDQFSRNIHRGTAAAFGNDPLALALAQAAVEQGADRALPPERRAFLYMPWMHSESRVLHQIALALFAGDGMDPRNLESERRHQAIIERFGRFPHRNAVLGRASTPQELAFLAQPGSAF